MIAISTTVAAGPSTLSVAAHVLYDGGVIAMAGIWLVSSVVSRDAASRLLRIAPWSWLAAGFGAVALAVLNKNALGVATTEFLGTHLGHAALIRTMPLLICHEGIVVARVSIGRARARALHAIGAGVGISIFGHVLATHSAGGSWPLVKLATEWIHIAAVSAWIGGLAMLLVAVRGAASEQKAVAVRRYSTAAGVAVVVVLTGGVARSLFEVNTIPELVRTTYGRLVLAKAELLLGLVVLGALNRYRHVPEASRTLTRLRRAGTAELAVGVVVLALSGILSGTAPAREAIAQPAPVTQTSVQASAGIAGVYTIRFSDGSSLQAFVDPARPGRNDIHLTFFTAAGSELSIRRLDVAVMFAARSSTPAITRFDPGHFSVSVDATPGVCRVDVRAVTAGGVSLDARFDHRF